MRGVGSTVTRVPVPDLCCLWAETGTTPMHIALLGTLDAPARGDDAVLAAIRTAVAAHLDRAPMLRRVLHPTRLGQGRPVWIDSPRFDLAQHVVPASLPRPVASQEDFLDWCAQESLRPLDRSRPLWRMSVIPGLPDGRVGLLVVAHHVVADGLRGVALIAQLLDADPTAAAVPAVWQPGPPPTGRALVLDHLRAVAAAVGAVRPRGLRRHVAAFAAMRTEIASRAPATVLTGDIGPTRRLVVLREPMAELSSTAHVRGCTINDLLLAAVTRGLREMLCAHDDSPPDLTLRATVPVGETADRQGGMIALSLPVGVADPDERLRRIVDQTTRGKQAPDAGVAGIVAMPAPLARLGVLWARRAARGHVNLYVTNVPGPPVPLYLAGARLRDVVPLAPLVAGVRLSVTALSYDGTLSVALLADEAVVDLHRLAHGVTASLHTCVAGR